MIKPISIDDYISGFPEETQKILRQLREIIKAAAPQAEEVISYCMPAYRMGGVLVYFAAFKAHTGFYPTASGIAAFKDELSDYQWSKGAVQFPYGKPLPVELITRIVMFRVDEVRQRVHLAGKTQKSGFQTGLRRTFPVSPDIVWDLLFSDEGIRLWLGDLVTGDLAVDREYQSQQGISGKVRILKPFSHIRLTWKKMEWPNTSTLQIRTIPIKTGTTISFHQENLLDGHQREEMRTYWEEKMSNLSHLFLSE